MTVFESLRAKVRPGLLRPNADGLDQALGQLLSIRDSLRGQSCSPAEVRTIRKELAGIELLARQIQQLYAAVLAVSSKSDDAAANYTRAGRSVTAVCDLHPATQIVHG